MVIIANLFISCIYSRSGIFNKQNQKIWIYRKNFQGKLYIIGRQDRSEEVEKENGRKDMTQLVQGLYDRVYGYEKRENTNFVVTSGISDWAIKFKTGCKSEYVIINIQGK